MEKVGTVGYGLRLRRLLVNDVEPKICQSKDDAATAF